MNEFLATLSVLDDAATDGEPVGPISVRLRALLLDIPWQDRGALDPGVSEILFRVRAREQAGAPFCRDTRREIRHFVRLRQEPRMVVCHIVSYLRRLPPEASRNAAADALLTGLAPSRRLMVGILAECVRLTMLSRGRVDLTTRRRATLYEHTWEHVLFGELRIMVVANIVQVAQSAAPVPYARSGW